MLLLSFVAAFQVTAQPTLRVQVKDRESGEPLAFAHLVFNDNPKMATLTDVDGRFVYRQQDLQRATCSYVGYRTETFAIKGNEVVLFLTRETQALEDVYIGPGVSRATQIIQKTIANKKKHHPDHLNAVRYKSYNKVTFDFMYYKNKRDSLAVSEKFKNSRLLLMESLTERKYMRPGLTEETITATRVSGFERPDFAALATDLQPFSFYEETIPLFNVHYLNPIANRSPSKYHYTLTDEYTHDADTVFVIAFKAKPGKSFDALKGVLYINSNGYAVQNVLAEPEVRSKVNIKIQQQYQRIQNHWFPEQLHYTLMVDDYPNPGIGLYSEGKSYLSQVAINPTLKRSEFSTLAVKLAPSAAKLDTLSWAKQRPIPLSAVEKNTYTTLDSLGKAMHFDRYLSLTEKLLQGRIPLGFVDLDLDKSLKYNQYEGLRLGIGLRTNERLSNRFAVGGFAGYGTQDTAWKYGAMLQTKPAPQSTLAFSFEHDLTEMGSYGLRSIRNWYALRDFLGYRYDQVKKYGIDWTFSPVRFVDLSICISQSDVVPKYEYLSVDQTHRGYSITSASLFLQYAFGQKRVQSFGGIFSTPTDYPVVRAWVEQGFKGALDSNFGYLRVEGSVSQKFHSAWGTTDYVLSGGYIDGTVPGSRLFTGHGAYDPNMVVVVKDHFQTMRPYEFLSDRFAQCYVSHHFGTVLRRGFFMPELALSHRCGWGNLTKMAPYVPFGYKTMDQVYLEAGLQLQNLLKLNVRNLGYLGLGVAGFYRYGAHALDRTGDNLAVKLALTYSVR